MHAVFKKEKDVQVKFEVGPQQHRMLLLGSHDIRLKSVKYLQKIKIYCEENYLHI